MGLTACPLANGNLAQKINFRALKECLQISSDKNIRNRTQEVAENRGSGAVQGWDLHIGTDTLWELSLGR